MLFLADGGIYEEGAPSEIFDTPKREKAIAFIQKIKYFTYEIKEQSFDLMALQGGIQNFGEKYGLDQKQIYRLQICSEELIYEMLGGCYSKDEEVDINLDISYSEAKGITELSITSGGKEFDPFKQDDDGLGITILKTMAKDINYLWEGNKNHIKIEL